MADLDEFFDEGDELELDEPELVIRLLRSLHPGAQGPAPRGNTPRALAGDARRQALREATGVALPEPDEWRQALRDGRRTRADALLHSRAQTHNSGAGFGPAQPNREVP